MHGCNLLEAKELLFFSKIKYIVIIHTWSCDVIADKGLTVAARTISSPSLTVLLLFVVNILSSATAGPTFPVGDESEGECSSICLMGTVDTSRLNRSEMKKIID